MNLIVSALREYRHFFIILFKGHWLYCAYRLSFYVAFGRGNVLEFPGMFKESHVWLQITLENQMPGEFGFPL